MRLVLCCVICLILGGVLGFIFAKKYLVYESSGEIVVKDDPDDGPYLFLELKEEIDELLSKKIISLKISQK